MRFTEDKVTEIFYLADEFCKEFYKRTETDQKLQPIINVVVDKFKDSLDTESQEDFKSKIQSYIRLYSYISQISSFGESFTRRS